MQKPSGLGRGLSSLIPTKKADTSFGGDSNTERQSSPKINSTGGEEISQLPVDSIVPTAHQPRHRFDEEQLKDLIESIREHGIIQPLIVTRLDDGKYQLIAGERRWRSAQSLGLKTVPAVVREFSEQKKLEVALIENLQRQDLNALEVAKAYQRLMDEFNLTQESLSKRVGKSRPAIANTVRLLTAAPEVQEAIEGGEISEGHARVLAGLPHDDQRVMLQQIKKLKLNVRDTEKAGKEIVVQKHLRKVAR
jgi:ParB family chromosome partitioning protein